MSDIEEIYDVIQVFQTNERVRFWVLQDGEDPLTTIERIIEFPGIFPVFLLPLPLPMRLRCVAGGISTVSGFSENRWVPYLHISEQPRIWRPSLEDRLPNEVDLVSISPWEALV
ncbi:hypothetical protein GCM10007094_23510 [Pseudovibrio japonicus]|uniref:Uncharacterized protein n=1 Tax=Pseudovibrio japonicus TaxID=366534 RepID=A0ABQ3ECV4_9HYPH|nr:hypothetical protein [Pseudovibrio japonicus]GHB33894.1 hypothetical protein GCM10007094_23510 [Pseudovibrio japonicus]